MYLALDCATPDLLTRVQDHLSEVDDRPLLRLTPDNTDSYVPGGKNNVVDGTLVISDTGSSAYRHRWLWMASKGLRIFSNHMAKDNPLYAGPLPESDEDIRRAVVAAKFAEGRAEYFASFGVNYIGRTNLSPRNIIVLDNKKGNPTHSPALDASLDTLYASLPNDWWGSCGFVSTGNVDKLGAFFDDFSEVIPLAYTTGAFAKMKYLGVDYATIGVPRADPQYGIEVREVANRFSYAMSQK